ncbi:hypothetical protein CXF71_00375 [Colwellia sp. 12G3]|nr:hypothetical protein CXF71_00375 [Colwellia sp. 12G3]
MEFTVKLTYLSCLIGVLLVQGCGQPSTEKNSVNAAAEDSKVAKVTVEQKPAPAKTPQYAQNVYFGDTHLHTSNSFDAGAFGNTLPPDVAYQYARGEQVTASMGLKTKLIKPLDFLVVADHSDNMGMIPDLYAGKKEIIANPMGKEFYDGLKAGKNHEVAIELIKQFSQGTLPEELNYDPQSQGYKDTWNRIIDSAEKYNDPGKFTAFIGYEWTSLIKGGNMHRVVIYRDGEEKGRQMVPYTTTPPYGNQNPRELWKWMQTYEDKTQGKILAIAHNGNLSNGIMFPMAEQFNGSALDKEYVESRARWEPLYEVTQMKGDGESHPFLSPNDEFADFENWEFGNLDLSEHKTNDMLAGEYGREALKTGLVLEEKFGTNPYKFGLIGSTDSHTSLATTEADNFFGKMSTMEPSEARLTKPAMQGKDITINYRAVVSSGLAAVWATENTRKGLFDAMERKETYATTGQRIQVRFFAGWDYNQADLDGDFVKSGYEKGVPMGGDLAAKTANAPSFMVVGMKDPDAANLDRLQVVKGWMDTNGKTHERIFDVACSDNRSIVERRCDKLVGNTVDVKTATYTNDIGETSLKALWVDPEFDAAQNAFYYVRVLAIPTPRWTTYDAVRYGAELPTDVPATIQDRAYTAPIWYNH